MSQKGYGDCMKSFKVMFSSVSGERNFVDMDEVKDFVNIVNEFDFDVDLVSGRYVVDAKSLMGIFSLQLAKPVSMRVFAEDTQELEQKLEKFIVK